MNNYSVAEENLRRLVIEHADGTVQVRDGACLGCGAPLRLVGPPEEGWIELTHKPECPYHEAQPLRLYDARGEDGGES